MPCSAQRSQHGLCALRCASTPDLNAVHWQLGAAVIEVQDYSHLLARLAPAAGLVGAVTKRVAAAADRRQKKAQWLQQRFVARLGSCKGHAAPTAHQASAHLSLSTRTCAFTEPRLKQQHDTSCSSCSRQRRRELCLRQCAQWGMQPHCACRQSYPPTQPLTADWSTMAAGAGISWRTVSTCAHASQAAHDLTACVGRKPGWSFAC